jgi:hypothetical protein
VLVIDAATRAELVALRQEALDFARDATYLSSTKTAGCLWTSFAFAALAHPAQAEREKLIAARREALEAMRPKPNLASNEARLTDSGNSPGVVQ